MLIIDQQTTSKEVLPGLQALAQRNFIKLSNTGLSLTYTNQTQEITYQEEHQIKIGGSKPYFFRVLSFLIAHPQTKITHTSCVFEHLTAMVDVSRNAVLNIEATYDFICDIALAGYDRLMLYMEDTFELKTDPYFGYMRGRYSKAEIKNIDMFSSMFGIELIPCIQTLAHLNQMKRWPVYRDIFDIQDILLVGEEKTYAFLDRILEEVADSFTSKNINIGMDEAYLLGRGMYASKHGLKQKEEIMIDHLKSVLRLVKKHGFKPMMWSDMFFKMGFHAYDKNIKLSENIIHQMDPDLTLIYWDYHSLDKNHYEERFKLHKQFHNEIAFAGGAWTWFGFTPHISYASKACKAAIDASKGYQINDFILTFWGDNGGECPPYAALPVVRRVASYAYGQTDEAFIDETFYKLYQINMNTFNALESPDLIVSTHQNKLVNPSKYLLYQDIFKGLFDRSVPNDVHSHYQACRQQLKKGTSHPRFGSLFSVLVDLSYTLSLKADLGVLTRNAYDKKDKIALKLLIEQRYIPLIKALKSLYKSHEKRWTNDHKPHGFDVQDYRLGGLIQRVIHQKDMILEYIVGKRLEISELEEPILPFNGYDSDGYYFNSHQQTISTNVV